MIARMASKVADRPKLREMISLTDTVITSASFV
jgi:hypothetical protein